MALSSSTNVLLAAMAGGCFSIMGVAYRVGEPRGVQPRQIVLVVGLAVGLFFLVQTAPALWLDAPAALWWWALSTGATQYATVLLLGAALRTGPLSPSWCAVMLGFLLGIGYSAAFQGEAVGRWELIGIAAGVACVIVGARTARKRPWEDPASVRPHRKLLFGFLLAGLLVGNGWIDMAMKALTYHTLSDGTAVMDRYREVFLTMMYLTLGGCLAIDAAVRRRFGAPVVPAVLLGLLAAAGSAVGVWAMTRASASPASVVFPVRSASSILITSTVAVAAFRERITAAWVLTVALGVATVVLTNAPALYDAVLGN